MIPATFCQNMLLLAVGLRVAMPDKVTQVDVGIAIFCAAAEVLLYLWEQRRKRA